MSQPCPTLTHSNLRALSKCSGQSHHLGVPHGRKGQVSGTGESPPRGLRWARRKECSGLRGESTLALTGLPPQTTTRPHPHSARAHPSHTPSLPRLQRTKEPFSEHWALGRAAGSAPGYSLSGRSWAPQCQAGATGVRVRPAPATPPRG